MRVRYEHYEYFFNKMRTLCSMIVCLLLLSEAKCYARMGETLEQCERRYGKRIKDKFELTRYQLWILNSIPHLEMRHIGRDGALKVDDETYYFFRLDEFVICVKFGGNKVDEIRFAKLSKFSGDGVEEISIKEIDVIVAANKTDVKFNSFYSIFKVLIIRTEEYQMKLNKKTADAKKALEDQKNEVLKKF